MGATLSTAGGRRRSAPLAEINVTPLVDVMLVLLIISMVAAPMLERGISMQLPSAETAAAMDEPLIVVSVDREARIHLNDRPIHPDLLAERMRQVAATRPDEPVFLRADRVLAYGEVLFVMDLIRKAGVTRVALVTAPAEAAGAAAGADSRRR
jgi:biopolymer transport protein TolR